MLTKFKLNLEQIKPNLTKYKIKLAIYLQSNEAIYTVFGHSVSTVDIDQLPYANAKNKIRVLVAAKPLVRLQI